MRKNIISIILSLLIAMSICPVALATGNDTTPPELLSVSLNKTEFAVGETVVITVVAKDNETGLDITPGWVGIGKDTTQSYCYALHSTELPDTYTASWTISDRTAPGIYCVNAVYLENNGVVGCEYSIYYGTLSNEFQFNVTNDVRTDWTGPTLDILTVDRTTANVGDTVTFSAKASDPSGVQSIYMYLYYNGVQSQTIYLKKATIQSIYFTGKFTVTSSIKEGNYTVGGVYLTDKLGALSQYTTADGSLPESMRYSINIINPNVTPPPGPVIIDSIEIITPHIKQGDPFTVKMQVDPNGNTSFGPIDLGYRYPNQSFFIDTAIRLNRQSGSNTFEGTRIIPPNSPAANYSLSSCYIWQNIPFDYHSFLYKCKQFVVESVFSGTENCSVSVGSVFDPLAGVSASNNTEGDMTNKIEVTGTVDTSQVGVYLIKYTIPSEYKIDKNDTKQYYYYDFRWVGVTEVLPSASADSPIVLTDGDVLIDAGEDEISLKKDGGSISYTDLVTEEGHYSVQLSDPDGTNSNAKQSVDFNIDQSAPEISLTQMHNSDGSTCVKADIQDLSEIVSLEWAAGERDNTYFLQNGNAFTGAFNAVDSGKYTVYAEDLLGNASVKVIDVEPAEYTVCVLSANSNYGRVSGNGKYNNAATVSLSAMPNPGCRFTFWTENGTQISTDAVYKFSSLANRTIIAEFMPIGTPAVSAASAGYNSVNIKWSSVEGAAGYEIWRSDSAEGNYLKIRTFSGTSYTDNGLSANTPYYYKVNAYCTASTATTYGSRSAYAVATPVPAAPTASASVTSYNSVKVSWNAVSGASGYELYRATSQNGGYSLVKKTSSLSYTNTGLGTGTTYYYKVRPYASGKIYGSYSAIVSAKPMLTAVTGVSASAYNPSSVKISWGAVSGRTKYEVWRSTSPTSGFVNIKTTNSTSYKDTTCTPFQTYYYNIRVYRTVSGHKVYSANNSVTVNAKPILNNVTGVKAAVSSPSSVKLSWSSVTGCSGYEIRRSTAANGTYTAIKTTSSRSYTDSNLTPNTTYYYQVVAYRMAGGKVYSTPCAPVLAKPVFGSVTNAAAVRSSASKIKLTWSAVSGRKGYIIYRSTNPDSGFVKIKSTTSTSFTDSGLTAGVTYYYKIQAYLKVGSADHSSGPSAVVSATP